MDGCLVCGAAVRHVNPAARRAGKGKYCSPHCKVVGLRAAYSGNGHNRRSGQSPTYKSWHAMKQRCLNPRQRKYAQYGGRGITVCERWLDFANFLADMGERPEGTTLDRIDGGRGYAPDNCRWATPKQQGNNYHAGFQFRVTYGARGYTLQELADKLGLDRYTLRGRIVRGWPEGLWHLPPSRKNRGILLREMGG